MKRVVVGAVLLMLIGAASGETTGGSEFKYDLVIICGPKKLSAIERVTSPSYAVWEYYEINVERRSDDWSRIVVLSDHRQFPSYREARYDYLFGQNGGLMSSAFEERGEDIVITLKDVEPDGSIFRKEIVIHRESLLYRAHNSRTSPTGDEEKYPYRSGVCWEP